MRAGTSSTVLISWTQTEIDGLEAGAWDDLSIGSAWLWHGPIEAADAALACGSTLCKESDTRLARKAAAQGVFGLVRKALQPRDQTTVNPLSMQDRYFVVTDGAKRYTITLIETGPSRSPLLMFFNAMPPRDTELLVIEQRLGTPELAPEAAPAGGVICFTPGTKLQTGTGVVPVETLRIGDLIQTKDNGLQPIEWVGARRMSGARLFAMPDSCPIRVRGGAFGIARPNEPLLVSPQHRLLVSGAQARRLFGQAELLIAARDLMAYSDLAEVVRPREVTYIHLLLPAHNVVWANGVQTESFHPASAAPESLREEDLVRLHAARPELVQNTSNYGGYARPNLSNGAAGLLLGAA
ncbi:MAG: Hint domain-containing protein [Pseudomonadota bacterium]